MRVIDSLCSSRGALILKRRGRDVTLCMLKFVTTKFGELKLKTRECLTTLISLDDNIENYGLQPLIYNPLIILFEV